MKTVTVCSSFRFYGQMLELKERLEDEGIVCLIPSKETKFRKPESPAEYVEGFDGASEEEKLSEAKRMTLDHFNEIDKADIVYIFAPDGGYIGKSVSGEIVYAFVKEKSIYCSEKLEGYSQMSFTNGILSPDELIESIKNGKI